MTPKNSSASSDDDSLGVLDDAASLDTASIGGLGQTAQVNVSLPRDEDDDLADDSVIDGELHSELIVDGTPVVDDPPVGRIQEDVAGIVIELPAEDPAGDVVEAVVEPEPEPEPESGSKLEPGSEGEAETKSDAAPETAEVVSVTPAAPKSEATPQPKPESETKAESETNATPETNPESETKPQSETKATLETKPRSVAKAEPEPEPEPKPESDQKTRPQPEPAPRSESATSAWIASALRQDDAASSHDESVATASASAEKVKSENVTTPEKDPKPSETAIAQRPAAARPEVELTSKRLGDQLGQSSRESADLLTADRLLDPHQLTKPEPEGAWSHFLYTISGRLINIGDGKRARARKALSSRISAPIDGGARFVPVLSRKGGVGKTTVTTLLGMALADARDDRVIAVDANPDRGTLADRIVRSHSRSVRDLVRIHDEVKGYHDVSAIVARDSTRLDVLASDSDPRIAEAFSDDDYRDVAKVAAHYYSLVLTDTGTGIVHSVMGATLDLADQLVIVSGLSVDEARLASETLTWLETNGYAEHARNAIIVLNQSTPGSPLVRLNELEAHFATRAKSVVRMPYDGQIAGGGAITFANLQPATREAARELAALLVEGLRAGAN